MIELDFSFDNPALTRIEAAKGKPGFTNMPSKALPPTLKAGASTIYEALKGETMDMESNSTISIKFGEDGKASSVYCPTIYKVDDGVAVRWGKELIPLVITDEGQILSSNTDLQVELELDSARVGGWDDTICLSVVVEGSGEEFAMNFPIRFASIADKPSKKVLANLLKKGKIGDFLAYVSEAKQGDNEPVEKFSAQPEGVYDIYEAKPISVSFGDTYIIRAHAPDGRDLKLWSPDKLTRFINSGMQVPIQFVIVEDPVSGSRRYDITGEFAANDDIDMSWLS